MEGYHVMETHPQLYPDRRSRTNVYRDVGPAKSSLEPRAISAERAAGAAIDPRSSSSKRRSVPCRPDQRGHGRHDAREGRPDRRRTARASSCRPTLRTAVGVWTQEAQRRHRGLEPANRASTARPQHIMANGSTVVGVYFCFPNYFLLPTLSSSVVVPHPPARTGGVPLRAVVAHPLPPGKSRRRRPDPPRWHPTIRAGPNPGAGLLQPAAPAARAARQGFRLHAALERVEGLIGNYHRLIDGYLAGLPDSQLVPANQHVGRFEIETRDIGI